MPPGFKRFFWSITRSSRNQSSTEPISSQPRSWKKPSSWKYVHSDNKKHDSTRRTDGISLHSYDSRALSERDHVEPETEVANTKSSCPTNHRGDDHDQSRLLESGGSRDVVLGSSSRSHGDRDSRARALTPAADIGCLPDGSWSDPDVARKPGRLGEKS